MKNYKLTIALIWLTCIGLILMVLLGSCKRTETITKIENKYITDTLILNGDTIIRNILVKEPCPECKPKTRLETRLEYRLDKRKLKALQSMYEDSLREARKIKNLQVKWKTKEVVKTKRFEAKTKTNWILLLVGFVIGVLTVIMLRRL